MTVFHSVRHCLGGKGSREADKDTRPRACKHLHMYTLDVWICLPLRERDREGEEREEGREANIGERPNFQANR